jgi:hypothetical protein
MDVDHPYSTRRRDTRSSTITSTKDDNTKEEVGDKVELSASEVTQSGRSLRSRK